jgi:hypothetical protein
VESAYRSFFFFVSELVIQPAPQRSAALANRMDTKIVYKVVSPAKRLAICCINCSTLGRNCIP